MFSCVFTKSPHFQDGPYAGQTVPHVHMHILPRRAGDFSDNDDVWRQIDAEDETQARRPRTHAEMAEEAAVLRSYVSLYHRSDMLC